MRRASVEISIQGKDGIYMHVREIFLCHMPDRVHIAEIEALIFSTGKYCSALFGIEKLPFFIEQFQRIPLLRVVGRSEYNAAIGLLEDDGHLCCRGRGISGLDYIYTAGQKSAADHLLHHLS